MRPGRVSCNVQASKLALQDSKGIDPVDLLIAANRDRIP